MPEGSAGIDPHDSEQQLRALEGILRDSEFAPYIVYERVLEAREGRYAPFPPDLDERLAAALRRRGIERLYTHQLDVWNTLKEGKNAAVLTPTASGKTLCYNLPCLDILMKDEKARCLYLFPTKALSQDQQSELNGIVSPDGPGGLFPGLPVKAVTYDG
ncbi:MAG: DEAD/DEAH box helicase, partial [Treponema sp.]|nr:DEAD/DEAH box helicase [Treponema sp.]